jgi:hypothetical protein
VPNQVEIAYKLAKYKQQWSQANHAQPPPLLRIPCSQSPLYLDKRGLGAPYIPMHHSVFHSRPASPSIPQSINPSCHEHHEAIDKRLGHPVFQPLATLGRGGLRDVAPPLSAQHPPGPDPHRRPRQVGAEGSVQVVTAADRTGDRAVSGRRSASACIRARIISPKAQEILLGEQFHPGTPPDLARSVARSRPMLELNDVTNRCASASTSSSAS